MIAQSRIKADRFYNVTLKYSITLMGRRRPADREYCLAGYLVAEHYDAMNTIALAR